MAFPPQFSRRVFYSFLTFNIHYIVKHKYPIHSHIDCNTIIIDCLFSVLVMVPLVRQHHNSNVKFVNVVKWFRFYGIKRFHDILRKIQTYLPRMLR